MSALVLLILRSVAALALYAFLGSALWLLWRDLRKQQQRVALRQAAPLLLQVELDGRSRLERFTSPEITIGRDPGCECSLASKTVSARHARLSYHHGHWWLEDLGSTNGTLLNQEFVTAPTVVTPGDQIRCGEAKLGVTKQENKP